MDMSQTFCSTLLLSPLLLESSASSSGSAASRFQFRFGAPLGRFRMDLGAPPERVAAKDKVAGSLALHVVPEEWQEASPLNQNKPSHNQPPRHPTNERTNKHTNTQPSKRTKQPTTKNRQTNKQTQEDTRAEPLPSLPNHGDDAIVQLELACH